MKEKQFRWNVQLCSVFRNDDDDGDGGVGHEIRMLASRDTHTVHSYNSHIHISLQFRCVQHLFSSVSLAIILVSQKETHTLCQARARTLISMANRCAEECARKIWINFKINSTPNVRHIRYCIPSIVMYMRAYWMALNAQFRRIPLYLIWFFAHLILVAY